MKGKIVDLVQSAKKIAISSHVRPDADCIGSGLALYLMLKQLGKEVCYCNTDPAPYPLTMLPHYSVITFRQVFPESFDLYFLIEGASEIRTGQKHIDRYVTINIDHHATSSNKAHLNWVRPEAAAVGEMIYDLGLELKIEFTRDIGFNLYAAIVSDTGSFKYSNTTAKSLAICAELIQQGGFKPAEVSNLLFNSNHLEKIQMVQKVLSTLEMALDRKVCLIRFERRFLKTLDLKDIETEDIISIARSISGVVVTLFFKEIGKDYYRVSMRSKGDFSSQRVALHFNGGGHDHAAGFFYKGKFDRAKKDIIEVLKQQMS
jgi:phosphoesterase RecJ-like protein